MKKNLWRKSRSGAEEEEGKTNRNLKTKNRRRKESSYNFFRIGQACVL